MYGANAYQKLRIIECCEESIYKILIPQARWISKFCHKQSNAPQQQACLRNVCW